MMRKKSGDSFLMLKKITLHLLLLLSFTGFIRAEDISGFWQTIDKKTNKPTSVIAVYPYEGKFYGRIIASFNKEGVMDDTIYKPVGKAPGIEGHPYYCGLDIVFDVAQKDARHYKGYIVDPKEGKTYRAELWKKEGNLILRGKVFVFGRNETWPPFPDKNFTDEFKKPDLATFIPKIPKTLD